MASRNTIIEVVKRALDADNESYSLLTSFAPRSLEGSDPQVLVTLSSDEIIRQPIGDCPLKWLMRLTIVVLYKGFNQPTEFYNTMDTIDEKLYIDFGPLNEDIIETELNRWDVDISSMNGQTEVPSILTASLMMTIRYVK